MFVSQANRTKDCLIREKKLQNKPWLINNHLNAKSHSNQCAFHLSTQYTTMLYWSLNSTSDQIKSLWGNGRGSETSVHPSTVTVWQIKQKPSWIHTADAKSTGFRKHALSQSNTTSRVYIWAFTVTFQRHEDLANTKPTGFRKHALAQSNTTFRVYIWAVADNDVPKTTVPLSAKVFSLHAVNAFTGVGTAIIPYFSLLVGVPMVNAHICKQNTVPWLSHSCTHLVGVYDKCTHLQTEWQTWQHLIQQTRMQIFVAKK